MASPHPADDDGDVDLDGDGSGQDGGVGGRPGPRRQGFAGSSRTRLTAGPGVRPVSSATGSAIEQAKGALMFAYGITADEAFTVLRSVSQDRNIKVREIAARLTADLAAPSGPGGSAAAARIMDRLLRQVSTGSGGTDRSDRVAGSG